MKLVLLEAITTSTVVKTDNVGELSSARPLNMLKCPFPIECFRIPCGENMRTSRLDESEIKKLPLGSITIYIYTAMVMGFSPPDNSISFRKVQPLL